MSNMTLNVLDPTDYYFSRRPSVPYRQLRPFFRSIEAPVQRLTLSLPKLVKYRKDYYTQHPKPEAQSVAEPKLQSNIKTLLKASQLSIKSHQAVSIINKRNYNQDRWMYKRLDGSHSRLNTWGRADFFAVYDGHGGEGCCNFLSKRLHQYVSRQKLLVADTIGSLKRAFDKAEQDFLEQATSSQVPDFSGSCVLVVLLLNQKLYVANLGDSKCLAYYKGQKSPRTLTVDHSPSRKHQYLRILSNGGKISKPHTTLRISPGNLNVSRTIGDANCKLRKFGGLPNVITHNPDVQTIQTTGLQYLILGTDGLYQGLSAIKIHEIYQGVKKCLWEQPDKMLRMFLQSVLEQGKKAAQDNITAIMILFQ